MMVRSLFAILFIATAALAQTRTDQHGDPLPDGAIARFGTLRYRIGTSELVYASSLSPDGKILAVETNSDIALWNLQTGRVGSRLPKPNNGDDSAVQLGFAPDGKSLVRLCTDCLHVLDVQTGKELCSLQLKLPGKAVAFLPGTSHFTLLQGDGTKLYVYDSSDGSRISEFEPDVPVQFASTSGGYFLGEYGSRWHIVDAATGRVRCRLPDSPDLDDVTNLLAVGHRYFCVRSTEGRVNIFGARTGGICDTVEEPVGWGNPYDASRFTFSTDSDIAYLSKPYECTHRRDVAAQKWLAPLPAMRGETLLPAPGGKQLVQVGHDHVIRRYSLDTLKEITGPLGFDTNVLPVPSPDGRRIAISSGDLEGRLDVFDCKSQRLYSMPFESSPGYPRWSSDGRLVAAADPRNLKIFEAATGKVSRVLKSPDPDQKFSGLVGFGASGKQVFAALHNGWAMAAFDFAGNRPARITEIGNGVCLDFSRDGTTMALSNGSDAPALFDLAMDRFRIGYSLPPPPRGGCGGGSYTDGPGNHFSPDGSHLLTLSYGIATLRDPVTGEARRTFRIEGDYVSEFAFSPDGLWLAAVSGDRTISLWDVPTGKSLVSWDSEAHHKVRSVAFAGSGRLVTSSDDLTALLWDLRPRKPLKIPAWEALNGDDPTEAYRAVWVLAEDPKGPEILRAKIAPAKPVANGPVQKWIADLGSNRFAVREEATGVLVDLGRRIEPVLRAARERTTSEEVRTRLDAVLAKVPRERNAIEVVHARAVAAMELAGTDAARKLLAEWAAGAPGARLTVDAKAALVRLRAHVHGR